MRIALSGFTGKDSTILSQIIKSLEDAHIQTLMMNNTNQDIAKEVESCFNPRWR